MEEIFDPDKYAEWEWETECSHSYSSYNVTKILWKRVPMAPDFAREGAELLRDVADFVTLGMSDLKDLSHECIEIWYKCTCCGSSQRFTADLNRSGKQFRCGYYSKEYNVRHTYEPSLMTVEFVKEKFNEMGDSYDLVSNNCSHWSERLWKKL